MKRNILALSLLSLSALALLSSNVDAFWCCHKHYTTKITCRPYNAFTPICWGNLVCDGCCPSPCGVASGCLPMTMGVAPWAGSGMTCMSPGFAPNYANASDRGPMQPMPDIRSTPFTPPMPMPVPSGPNVSMNPYYGVAQANYSPYTPMYYTPVYYTPYQGWSQPMPYYWYGAGR